MNRAAKFPRAEFRHFVCVCQSWWPHKPSTWSKESGKTFQGFGGGVNVVVSKLQSEGKPQMQWTFCVRADFPQAVQRLEMSMKRNIFVYQLPRFLSAVGNPYAKPVVLFSVSGVLLLSWMAAWGGICTNPQEMGLKLGGEQEVRCFL